MNLVYSESDTLPLICKFRLEKHSGCLTSDFFHRYCFYSSNLRQRGRQTKIHMEQGYPGLTATQSINHFYCPQGSISIIYASGWSAIFMIQQVVMALKIWWIPKLILYSLSWAWSMGSHKEYKGICNPKLKAHGSRWRTEHYVQNGFVSIMLKPYLCLQIECYQYL